MPSQIVRAVKTIQCEYIYPLPKGLDLDDKTRVQSYYVSDDCDLLYVKMVSGKTLKIQSKLLEEAAADEPDVEILRGDDAEWYADCCDDEDDEYDEEVTPDTKREISFEFVTDEVEIVETYSSDDGDEAEADDE